MRVLAIFDKPDALEGPFFEETIYVTPSSLPVSQQQAIEKMFPCRSRGHWTDAWTQFTESFG